MDGNQAHGETINAHYSGSRKSNNCASIEASKQRCDRAKHNDADCGNTDRSGTQQEEGATRRTLILRSLTGKNSQPFSSERRAHVTLN